MKVVLLIFFAATTAMAMPTADPSSQRKGPNRLKVVLMNDVKDKWSTSDGIYVLASTKENTRPYWLQEGGEHAIWYDPEFTNWKLGLASQIGSSVAKLLTDKEDTGTALPHATPWKYLLNEKWTASDDILVTPVEAFTCPTERSTSDTLFKVIEGKCYYIDNSYRTFEEAQDFCQTVFDIAGKVFEPTSLYINNAVLNAAKRINGVWTFWVGASNGDYKYSSNGLPVSFSIPWYDGQPSLSRSQTQCLNVGSRDLKWYADTSCSDKYSTICETDF